MASSAKFIDKAWRELRKNEGNKRESLRQFREFIRNHRFIKSCRQDDRFLLQFLRKFNTEKAFSSFENFFLFRQKYEKWCNIDDDQMKRVWEIYESGFAYSLKERDDEGKRIILLQARKLDTSKFTSSDDGRVIVVIVATLMKEQESQISGISTICDFTGAGYNYFKLFSIRDIKDFADCAKNASIGREKENFFVNLPALAAFLFEIGRRALTEKLRQRIITTKSMNQLKTYIDPNLLPLEHGGSVSEVEMLEDFRKTYETHEAKIREISEVEIDWEFLRQKGDCCVM